MQGSGNNHSKYIGSGLGTSIVKRFVELMGGQIQAESTIGEGSRFTFNISCDSVGSERAYYDADSDTYLNQVSLSTNNELIEQDSLANLRVLLAEDDLIAQRIIIKRFSKAGIHVNVVDNGEDALKEIAHESYDLLLTDIRMPKFGGLELTKRIRNMEKSLNGSRLMIIGLSAHALEEVVQECLDAGMDYFMSKPADPEDIIATISMHRNKPKE